MIKKKHRVLETVTTVDGTLYKDEVVTFENEEADGDWRVKDNMGRIWYVNPNKLTKSPIQLSRSKQWIVLWKQSKHLKSGLVLRKEVVLKEGWNQVEERKQIKEKCKGESSELRTILQSRPILLGSTKERGNCNIESLL